MTGKMAQSYYVLTTATFQAYRRLTVKCVGQETFLLIANVHAYMRMRIRNVGTYGIHYNWRASEASETLSGLFNRESRIYIYSLLHE